MSKTIHQAYHQLRVWFDPALEGSPYDKRVKIEKSKTIYRLSMSKVSKQLIVR